MRHHALQHLLLAAFVPALLLALLCGCQTPPQPDGPTEMTLRIVDRDAFFDETLTVLRESDFRPQQLDRVEGVAIAGPSTGGRWFEFWRLDNQDPYQALENNLHTIRRLVIVRVSPASGPTTQPEVSGEIFATPAPADQLYRVGVTVEKSRYSAPDRQLTTAVGSMAIYSSRLPTEEGLRNARAAGEHWVPLGRDQALEELLLARIADRAGQLPNPPAVSASPASAPAANARAANPPAAHGNNPREFRDAQVELSAHSAATR